MTDPNPSFLIRRLARVRIGHALRGASFLLFATVSTGALINGLGLAEVRIGGPIHQDMVEVRNLLIEASPPILYLSKPARLALRLGGTNTAADAQALADQLLGLRRDFDAKVQTWTDSSLAPDLRAEVQAMADGAAADLWNEIEGTLIPLVLRRTGRDAEPAQMDTAGAIQASTGRVWDLFDTHATEIAALNEKIRAELDGSVALAAAESGRVMTLSWLVVAASVVVLLAIMRAGNMVIVGPIQGLTDVTNRLAARDYGTRIPFTDWTNEVGQLARSLNTLRDAAQTAQALEAEVAERNRQAAAEAEAAARDQASAAAAFSATLGRFVAGDLTTRVEAEVSDAYASIKRDLNAGLEQVRVLLAGMRSGVGEIRASTMEIATAAEDLSRRTETQAANLEETAAAVEEITATVKAAAESSSHARQVVSATKSDAERSGEVVERAVAAMSAIEGSSRQISQIIGVIDEIAFQTNLLALNAGVEAARAGEAGRGFAVVATEVRALAQRSAEAAKQIKGLISSSTTQVDQGVDLVAETGQALRRIVQSVNEINELIVAIAAGASEQSAGLAQVNVAIAQMDQITQQNAAMVEETTAAVRVLASQSEGVTQQVDRFRTGAGQHTALPAENLASQVRPEPRAPGRRERTAEPKRLLRVAGGLSRPALDDGWEEF